MVADVTSVIVVAADSGPLLRDCVDRAFASTAAEVEVVLVDNASGDGWPQRVAAMHREGLRLRMLQNEANLGFGAACNRGAAVARGDMLLFLNPDCLLEPQTVSRLRDVLGSDSQIAVIGVAVCDARGHTARGNRRRDPTLRRALMTMTGLARLDSQWPGFAGVEMQPGNVPLMPVEYVEAVSGACICVPRNAFERLHGFDEGYFLHCEDLDLCRRARDAGGRVAIANEVRVCHFQGSSSHGRPWFVSRHKHRSMWRYFRKFDPASRKPLLRLLVWGGIWTHFVLSMPRLLLKGVRARPPRAH
ncbi:MAG: glycosyltransferase family 2 protein [Rhodanobacteraceae bacterium]